MFHFRRNGTSHCYAVGTATLDPAGGPPLSRPNDFTFAARALSVVCGKKPVELISMMSRGLRFRPKRRLQRAGDSLQGSPHLTVQGYRGDTIFRMVSLFFTHSSRVTSFALNSCVVVASSGGYSSRFVVREAGWCHHRLQQSSASGNVSGSRPTDIRPCGVEARFRGETLGASHVCGGGRTVYHSFRLHVVVDVLEDIAQQSRRMDDQTMTMTQ